MNLYAFLVVIGVTSVFAAPLTDDPPQNVNEVGPFNSLRRMAGTSNTERRFGSDDSPEAAMCAARCLEQYAELQRREVPNIDQTSEDYAKFDRATLEKLCAIHQVSNTCVGSCEPSSVKTMHEKSGGIMNELCTPSFINRAQCLHEVSRDTNATCRSPSKCGGYITQVEEFKRNPRPTDDKNEVLKQFCLATNCKLNCAKEQVISRCGADAQRHMDRVATKAVEYLVYIFKSLRLVQNAPPQCSTIGSS